MRCSRPGPKTNNPFLNFMRVFRRKYCGKPMSELAIEGAKCWCQMTPDQKRRFYREACSKIKKKRSRSKSRSKSRKSRRCGGRSRKSKRRKSRRPKRSKKGSRCL
ncbi:protamine-like [Diorhabda sublineata]|uniref:protamine-like n=1 Tax=Diorhabda sublineata TaxID=1163346 RepID=UPI0024E1163F|nr:protamine-like [Diorhabda sublineata]